MKKKTRKTIGISILVIASIILLSAFIKISFDKGTNDQKVGYICVGNDIYNLYESGKQTFYKTCEYGRNCSSEDDGSVICYTPLQPGQQQLYDIQRHASDPFDTLPESCRHRRRGAGCGEFG